MSFGFSLGDFFAVGEFAWKVYKSCKGAGSAFTEVQNEVLGLHTALRELHDETENPDSIFNRTGAGKRNELGTLVRNCMGVLKDLNKLLIKYKSLGTSSKRTWDRVKFGAENLQEIRDRLLSHTSSLTLFLTTLGTGSLGRIEKKLDELIADVRAGRRERTILTIAGEDGDDDSETQWNILKSDLADEGVPRSDIERHKHWIKAKLTELVENGDLEEQESLESLNAKGLDQVETLPPGTRGKDEKHISRTSNTEAGAQKKSTILSEKGSSSNYKPPMVENEDEDEQAYEDSEDSEEPVPKDFVTSASSIPSPTKTPLESLGKLHSKKSQQSDDEPEELDSGGHNNRTNTPEAPGNHVNGYEEYEDDLISDVSDDDTDTILPSDSTSQFNQPQPSNYEWPSTHLARDRSPSPLYSAENGRTTDTSRSRLKSHHRVPQPTRYIIDNGRTVPIRVSKNPDSEPEPTRYIIDQGRTVPVRVFRDSYSEPEESYSVDQQSPKSSRDQPADREPLYLQAKRRSNYLHKAQGSERSQMDRQNAYPTNQQYSTFPGPPRESSECDRRYNTPGQNPAHSSYPKVPYAQSPEYPERSYFANPHRDKYDNYSNGFAAPTESNTYQPPPELKRGQGGGEGGFSFASPEKIFSDFMRGLDHDDINEFYSKNSNGSNREFTTNGVEPEVTTVERPLKISLEEMFTGVNKKMKITRKTIDELGGMSSSQERILELDIKPGLKKGSKVKFKGVGDQERDGRRSDLHFIIEEKPHPLFTRKSDDIHMDLRVNLFDSLFGIQQTLTTIAGKQINFERTGITPPGTSEIFAGHGMPNSKKPNERGDFVVTINIEYPTHLSEFQKRLLRKALLDERN
ncbi:dnaJ heat shock family protein [Phlyctema vagabunda]|uniref:DnaJ heat shock family protein n=1 Tax=Phlyctema vagabunda TaxID=108571 RepID=A0ABR4PL21_9HELO